MFFFYLSGNYWGNFPMLCNVELVPQGCLLRKARGWRPAAADRQLRGGYILTSVDVEDQSHGGGKGESLKRCLCLFFRPALYNVLGLGVSALYLLRDAAVGIEGE